MGLREEWEQICEAVARVATDVARLTTITQHRRDGEVRAEIHTEVQLDGDTTTWVTGAGEELRGCHRATVAFTSELADARLRMLARVIRALVP